MLDLGSGVKKMTLPYAISGQWHHFAITWRSSNGDWRFFVDGNAVDAGQGLRQVGLFLGQTFLCQACGILIRQVGFLSGRTSTQASGFLPDKVCLCQAGQGLRQVGLVSGKLFLFLAGQGLKKVAFFQARFLYFRQEKNSGK